MASRHPVPQCRVPHHRLPDLRGSGDSSKPSGGFDKKTMAGDLAELIDFLGVTGAVHVVGRDWGAPTALALALHWHRAKSLTYIENLVPGFGLEEAVQPLPAAEGDSFFQSGGINHFTFHLMPDVAGIPHCWPRASVFRLVSQAPGVQRRRDRRGDSCRVCALPIQRRPTTLKDSRKDLPGRSRQPCGGRRRRLTIPVLALGGEFSVGTRAEQSLRLVADRVEGHAIPGSGHWATEEQPEWVARRVLRFLTR